MAMTIGDRMIGSGQPTYIVAELSANHRQSFDEAASLVRLAAESGADAVKLQTYTADSMTIAADTEWLTVPDGTPWAGRRLHDLYQEAHTPWEWQPDLRRIALDLGIELFSSAFDTRSIEFLEGMGVPAYKVASFEIVDHGLIAEMAATGKPLIISTGMATFEEISEAVGVALEHGSGELILLKCTSAYPAPEDEMNLSAIPLMRREFGLDVGLSDHTLGTDCAATAVALGAVLIEKHLTSDRKKGGPDSGFSLEPSEFQEMVRSIRATEMILGEPVLGPGAHERSSLAFRRSIFAVADIEAGEVITSDNVRVIRPGHGLPPKHLDQVLGKRALQNIARGTPIQWDLVDGDEVPQH